MFQDFMNKIEIVHVVLLGWGFAQVAGHFVSEPPYVLASIISGFVLIRFLFATSHNLKPVVGESKGSLSQQRFLFFFDIPMLILHAFIYYRMNYLLYQRDYAGFYTNFNWLLFINVVWLFTVNLRTKVSKDMSLSWCFKWYFNNLAHVIIIYFLLRFW